MIPSLYPSLPAYREAGNEGRKSERLYILNEIWPNRHWQNKSRLPITPTSLQNQLIQEYEDYYEKVSIMSRVEFLDVPLSLEPAGNAQGLFSDLGNGENSFPSSEGLIFRRRPRVIIRIITMEADSLISFDIF